MLDLTSFAVAFRYPGESATREMARLAVANAKQIREQIRRDMRLKELPLPAKQRSLMEKTFAIPSLNNVTYDV